MRNSSTRFWTPGSTRSWAGSRTRGVRDTGPFIAGGSYGTHPAVRIFYSPEVYAWLKAGRPEDQVIPDGAMIIKEMYTPPAARFEGLTDAELEGAISGWTVMVQDNAGSKDGWFWAYYAPREEVDTNKYPFSYSNAGFGQYCVRCHASSEGGFTFASLRNIEGEPGERDVQPVRRHLGRPQDRLHDGLGERPADGDRRE